MQTIDNTPQNASFTSEQNHLCVTCSFFEAHL